MLTIALRAFDKKLKVKILSLNLRIQHIKIYIKKTYF